MTIWTLAKKELRLLVRDRLGAIILLGMPLLFILILGLLLGENFGQRSDDRLRITLLDLDEGPGLEGQTWAEVVKKDLAETAGIKVETVQDRTEAEQLIAYHKKATILIFEPTFSRKINQCSFLVDGINPFHRDGVYLHKIDAHILKDSKQPGASSIIEQVAQVSLLRVLLPWMIGRAFDRLSDPGFIQILGDEVNLPVPAAGQLVLGKKITLGKMLEMAAGKNTPEATLYRQKVGEGVKVALREQFKNYNLTGKTWASLTRSLAKKQTLPTLAASVAGLLAAPAGLGPLVAVTTLTPDRSLEPAAETDISDYINRDGSGFLSRGAQRYQILVPSYTVMFAFFLVMNVGWVFVAERRQGTLKRLQAAPITRGQILLGKLVPYFLLSLGQGLFLLVAGRLIFGMRWGPESWSLLEQLAALLPVVFTTSMAAMGLALLVAAVARSELQVALYGAVPVLILALIGGCVLPREMMPEQAQAASLLTPQGWALDAYRELLDPDSNSVPNLIIVYKACGVLACFGVVFSGLAWWLLRLD